jgi:excisionase family DNA binding protein
MKGIMTITEAAAYLATSEAAIYKMVESESIPHHRMGKRIVFVQAEIDQWVALLAGTSVKVAAKNRSTALEQPFESPSSHEVTAGEPIVLKRRPVGPRFTRKTAPE